MKKKQHKLMVNVYDDFEHNNGKLYYEAALYWYSHQYLSCLHERMFFGYSAIILWIVLATFHGIYDHVLPLHVTFPIVGSNSNIENIMTVVKVAAETDATPAISLARYFVTQYVINRETYNYNNINERKEYILNNSTSIARVEYEREYLDIHNPNSVLSRYQINGYRNVTIKKVTLISNYDGEPYRAMVTATINESSATGERLITNISIALQFDMPNLQLVYMNYMPFSFKVSQYNIIGARSVPFLE